MSRRLRIKDSGLFPEARPAKPFRRAFRFLPAPACPCLPLSASACPCLLLSASACPCPRFCPCPRDCASVRIPACIFARFSCLCFAGILLYPPVFLCYVTCTPACFFCLHFARFFCLHLPVFPSVFRSVFYPDSRSTVAAAVLFSAFFAARCVVPLPSVVTFRRSGQRTPRPDWAPVPSARSGALRPSLPGSARRNLSRGAPAFLPGLIFKYHSLFVPLQGYRHLLIIYG